jgi:hypothetical protein
MINLPKNFSGYTLELKQEAVRLNIDLSKEILKEKKHDALADARWNMKCYKYLRDLLP